MQLEMKKKASKKKKKSLMELLGQMVAQAKSNEAITLREISSALSGRGYGLLLILFSLPFCLPITIPGLSTPFGIFLGFLGLRLAFGQRLWWPNWILEKKISYNTLNKIVQFIHHILKIAQKFLYPRLLFMVDHPVMRRLHGVILFLLSLLLSLPLPVPFTNTLAAIPICCLGFGLLEEDGLAVLISYLFSFITFTAFALLFWLGGTSLHKIFNLS